MPEAPSLPYVVAPGRIASLLQKVQEAQTPARFTQDFLDTKLGLKGGSAAPLIPLLKRIGFLENTGTPTDLYRKYRNPDTAGFALAEGLRKGYAEIFSRNEYANELSRDKFLNLVVEITGKEKEDRVVGAIVGTFWALREKAKFDEPPASEPQDGKSEELPKVSTLPETQTAANQMMNQLVQNGRLGLNLSYTVNLNLPETDDINVFNAIFKSLKENMLKN